MVTIKSFADVINSIFDYIKYILSGIAAVSLLVGGIGILNVMMLTVRERTKEIGLMKAVGATTGNVRLLFLAEASMLGIVSGIIGLILAYIIGYVIGTAANMPMPISMQNVAIGIGFGFLTTTIAGVYPGQPGRKARPHRSAAHRVKLSKIGKSTNLFFITKISKSTRSSLMLFYF